jgi:hypothetical protein
MERSTSPSNSAVKPSPRKIMKIPYGAGVGRRFHRSITMDHRAPNR